MTVSKHMSKSAIYKYLFIFICLLSLAHFDVSAQVPLITGIDKGTTYAGDIVTIAGSGFGTDPNQVVVQFGAARGSVVEMTDHVIVARVPAGANYSIVSVTNLASDKTGYSAKAFGPSYQGDGSFAAADLKAPVYLQSRPGLFDMCACDFDLDGLNDMATANDQVPNTFISLHRNTSTPTTVSFVNTDLNIGIGTKNITCGDLNSDGLPDLIISQGGTTGDRIFLYRNQSTPGNLSFTLAQTLIVNGNNARIPRIHDLDADGLPDIIVTNESNNRISIFRNNSTGNNFGFSTTVFTLTMASAASSTGIGVEDFDGDNLPEIIVNPNFENNLIIFKNTSSTGNLRFSELPPINVGQSLVQLRIADVDGEGRPDILVTRLLGSDVAILLNQTVAGGDISFRAPTFVTSNARPWGVDVGDLNGDGLPDMAIGAVQSGVTSFDVYINTSTPGSASFSRININAGARSRNIKIVDLTGDSKPEIVTAQVDDNKLAIYRNANCLKPVIAPDGPIQQCVGSNVTLYTNAVDGLSYQWRLNGSPIAGTGSSLAVTASGDYTVVATSEGGACAIESDPRTVSFQSGTIPPNSTATNSGLTCVGDNMQLFASAVTSASYIWSGPSGFSSTDQNPTLTNVTLDQVGYYFLEISNGSCESLKDTTLVEISSLPDLSLSVDGLTTFCTGGSVSLEVPNLDGYSYQWQKDAVDISGATGATLSASTTGDYILEYINGDGCSAFTEVVTVLAADIPVPGFSTSVTEACVNEAIDFSNSTTFDTNFTPTYAWSFGDGGASSGTNPQYAYTSSGNFTVSLTVGYSEVAGCSDNTTLNISVSDAPAVSISADPGTDFCRGDTITLTATPGLADYLWDDDANSTTNSIQVTAEGTYTVGVVSSIGCDNTANITLNYYPVTSLNVSADPATIQVGDTVSVSASGAVSYNWSPDSIFVNGTATSDMAQAVPIGPGSPYLSVSAVDANGCTVRDSVQVEVTPGPVVLVVDPAKYLTPNGDGQDETWVIGNILSLPQCTVMVFNRSGQKVFEQSAYANDWDGTNNGVPLREGAYYYVIVCEGETISKGTVNLLR